MPKRRSLVSRNCGSIVHLFGIVIDQRRRRRVPASLVARHHGFLISFACTHTTAPTCWASFAVTRASVSLRARPPLPTHSVAGLVVPSASVT